MHYIANMSQRRVSRGKLQFLPNKPRTLTGSERRFVLERDGEICTYCGDPATQVDHIMPWSYYPDNNPDNLASACQTCNLMAGNKLFKNFAHKKTYLLDEQIKLTIKSVPAVWTIAEFEELGRTMQRRIVDKIVLVTSDEEKQHAKQILDNHRLRLREELGRTLLPRGEGTKVIK